MHVVPLIGMPNPPVTLMDLSVTCRFRLFGRTFGGLVHHYGRFVEMDRSRGEILDQGQVTRERLCYPKARKDAISMTA